MHHGSAGLLAVDVDRWDPRTLGLGEDRLADVGVDLPAQGEADLTLAQVPGQAAAASGAVGDAELRVEPLGEDASRHIERNVVLRIENCVLHT